MEITEPRIRDRSEYVFSFGDTIGRYDWRFSAAPMISRSMQLLGECYTLVHVQMLRYLLTYLLITAIIIRTFH